MNTPTQEASEAEVKKLQELYPATPTQLPAVADRHAKIAAAEPKPRKPSAPTNVRNIVTALAAVTAEVGIVAKLGHNKFHGYKYAAMQDVLQKIAPLIGKHGLIIMQTEVPDGRKFIDDGRAIAVEYEFTIAHSSGEVWPDRPRQTGLCKCRDSKGGFDDKSFNKCHTAARKYFLLSLFQIATGEEDDADRERAGDAGRGPKAGPNVMNAPPYTNEYNADTETGEILEPSPGMPNTPEVTAVAPPPPYSPYETATAKDAVDGGATLSVEDRARKMARMGADALSVFWGGCKPEDRDKLRKIQDELMALRENAEAGKQGRVK